MSNFDEVFERIKLATHTRTQIGLAKVLDIRQSSISDAKRRNSIPPDWCIKLFERFGLNPDWIKRGIGPMHLRTEAGYALVDASPTMTDDGCDDYSNANAKSITVNVYSMNLRPSEEGGDAGFMSAGKLCIPQSFSRNGLKVFELDSASMEPIIRKGAYIGVDSLQTRAVFGELCALALPYEGVAIKRAFLNNATGEVVLRAENPQHPEMILPMAEFGKSIIGRVVWTLNKY